MKVQKQRFVIEIATKTSEDKVMNEDLIDRLYDLFDDLVGGRYLLEVEEETEKKK